MNGAHIHVKKNLLYSITVLLPEYSLSYIISLLNIYNKACVTKN